MRLLVILSMIFVSSCATRHDVTWDDIKIRQFENEPCKQEKDVIIDNIEHVQERGRVIYATLKTGEELVFDKECVIVLGLSLPESAKLIRRMFNNMSGKP